MKVIVLVPRVHFYAPLALKELIINHPNLDYEAYVTPKVHTDGTFLSGIIDLVKSKGIRYFLEQSSLRFVYLLLNQYEEILDRNIKDRRWLDVKSFFETCDLQYQAIESVREPGVVDAISDSEPDLLLSVFFNQIIPGEILDLPERGSFNLHPGTLPEFRGTSPVFWQLYEDVDRAGCALHDLTTELDSGDVVDQKKLEIRTDDTVHSLYRKLARLGGVLLSELVDNLKTNSPISLTPQDENRSFTYNDFGQSELSTFRENRAFWTPSDFLND